MDQENQTEVSEETIGVEQPENVTTDKVVNEQPVVQQTSNSPVVENDSDKKSKKAKKSKKKIKNPFLRFIAGIFKTILWIILVIILALVAWFTYSALDKKNSISYIPSDFSVFVSCDSVWDTVEPIFDLQAADIILSEEKFSTLRGTFMKVRSLDIRKTKLVSLLIGKRKLEAGVYLPESFDKEAKVLDMAKVAGVVELGPLSGVTRIAKYIAPYIYIKGLEYNKEDDDFIFVNKDLVVYLKPYHNLLIFSTDADVYKSAISGTAEYTHIQKTSLAKKDDQNIRIFLDTHKLVSFVNNGSAAFDQLDEIFDYSQYSKLSFSLSEQDINLRAFIPYINKPEVQEKFPVIKTSTVPALISKLPENVQYYTLYNAGSLADLINTAVPFLPESVNFYSLWNVGNGLSKSLLGATLDDLLFSWTGSEIAVFGLEGKNDLVFAIQIADERQRRNVFDNFLSSLVMREDTSLILDGVRLPRLQLPPFLQNIINVFGVSLSMPYYMVEDNYIYFSASPECLSNLHSAFKQIGPMTKNVNYKHVAQGLDNNVMLSLYYDLERSIPFFLRSKASITKVLELYTLGRFDVSIRNGNVVVQLQATSEHAADLRDVPGFPKAMDGKNNGYLFADKSKSPTCLFWVNGNNVVETMGIPSAKLTELELNESVSVCAVEKVTKDKFVIWAVTKSGVVYLLDKDLNIAPGFPLITDVSLVDQPVAFDEEVMFVSSKGEVCTVNKNAEFVVSVIAVSNSLMSCPTVLAKEKIAAVYDKGFLGKIMFLKDNGSGFETEQVVSVAGIGFGSPALLYSNSKTYGAFITQGGMFYLWCNGEIVEGYPVKIDGVYSVNARAMKDGFCVISESGVITKIGLDGSTLSVSLPNGSAKTAYLSIRDDVIYVSADSNTIYAFDSNMELIYGYPVTGWGVPAFADINGDNKLDLFALGLDNTMNCWKIK